MTSAVGKPKSGRIIAYPLGKKHPHYSANLVLVKDMWDIAVFQIELGQGQLTYSSFPNDCSLSGGQQLLHISEQSRLVVGRVLFSCEDVVPRLDDNKLTCKMHVPGFFDEKPSLRVMDNVCNDATCNFKDYPNYGSEDDGDEADENDEDHLHPQLCINSISQNLHPKVTIIHTSDICFTRRDSGSPLFNCAGEVVGMMVFDMGTLSWDGFAIHSSLLKQALNEARIEEAQARARERKRKKRARERKRKKFNKKQKV